MKPTEEQFRALRVLALTNDARLSLFAPLGAAARPLYRPEAIWFLEHIDAVAPGLRENGWARVAKFDHEPGSCVVSDGSGEVQKLVITETGRKVLGEHGDS